MIIVLNRFVVCQHLLIFMAQQPVTKLSIPEKFVSEEPEVKLSLLEKQREFLSKLKSTKWQHGKISVLLVPCIPEIRHGWRVALMSFIAKYFSDHCSAMKIRTENQAFYAVRRQSQLYSMIPVNGLVIVGGYVDDTLFAIDMEPHLPLDLPSNLIWRFQDVGTTIAELEAQIPPPAPIGGLPAAPPVSVTSIPAAAAVPPPLRSTIEQALIIRTMCHKFQELELIIHEDTTVGEVKEMLSKRLSIPMSIIGHLFLYGFKQEEHVIVWTVSGGRDMYKENGPWQLGSNRSPATPVT